MLMRVSILVPVYGVEKYIGECAETLFSQTYQNIEFIFVDDCGKDRSIAVLRGVVERFPERAKDIRILRHRHNRGLGAARATALAASSGDAIMHVDSDDALPVRAVELLVERMAETGADMVDGAFCEMAGGELTRTVSPAALPKKKYLRRMLCQNVVSNRIWGRLYKRNLYRCNEINSIEGIDYCEDYAAVPRLLFFARHACTSEVVYHYRTDNSASYTHCLSDKNILSFLNACQLVAGFFSGKDIRKQYRTALDIGMVNAYRNAMLQGISLERVDEICRYRVNSLVPRLCIWLLRKGIAVKWVNLPYLSFRKFYLYLKG
jgi:glycosyltransferase involved in cell wall biosynthesis